MGRPTIYTAEIIEDFREKLEDYINKSDIPIVVEFCYLNDIRKERVYEFARKNDKFSHSLKRCTEKKEAQLEKLALIGAINPTMAIFSLKQLGWRDKQNNDDDIDLSKITDAIRTVVSERVNKDNKKDK